MGEELWREEFCSDRPKGKKKNQLVKGGKAIVSAESELAFHPKERRRGGGNEKDIREPALKGGKIKSPAVERIQEEGRKAKRVERVAEALQKRAVIRIPAPRATVALMINNPIRLVYQRAKLGVKRPFNIFWRVFFSGFLKASGFRPRAATSRQGDRRPPQRRWS